MHKAQGLLHIQLYPLRAPVPTHRDTTGTSISPDSPTSPTPLSQRLTLNTLLTPTSDSESDPESFGAGEVGERRTWPLASLSAPSTSDAHTSGEGGNGGGLMTVAYDSAVGAVEGCDQLTGAYVILE